MNFLYYQALGRLPVGIAVAVEFIGPLTVTVLTSRRPMDFLWIAIAATRFALLLPVVHQTHLDPTGMLFALAAGACWAPYIVFGQRVGHHLGPRGVALGSLISAVLIVPIGLYEAPPTAFSRAVLLPGLAVAAPSTALPNSLEIIALTRLPTRTFGAVAGMLFLGERLAPSQWSAILLVILASVGAATTARQQIRSPVPD